MKFFNAITKPTRKYLVRGEKFGMILSGVVEASSATEAADKYMKQGKVSRILSAEPFDNN